MREFRRHMVRLALHTELFSKYGITPSSNTLSLSLQSVSAGKHRQVQRYPAYTGAHCASVMGSLTCMGRGPALRLPRHSSKLHNATGMGLCTSLCPASATARTSIVMLHPIPIHDQCKC
jgi:hypothetical protein